MIRSFPDAKSYVENTVDFLQRNRIARTFLRSVHANEIISKRAVDMFDDDVGVNEHLVNTMHTLLDGGCPYDDDNHVSHVTRDYTAPKFSISEVLEFISGCHFHSFVTQLPVECSGSLRFDCQFRHPPQSNATHLPRDAVDWKISPKKKHEVLHLSSKIHEYVGSGDGEKPLIVDVGGGRGYLSTALASLNYDVIVMDSGDDHTKSAKERAQAYSASSVKVVQVWVDDNLDVSRECGDRDVCMVGLHTCGNLSPALIRIFVRSPTVKTLVQVGCCYNLLYEHLVDSEPSYPVGFDANKYAPTRINGFPMSSCLRHLYDTTDFRLGCLGRKMSCMSFAGNSDSGRNPIYVMLLFRAAFQDLLKTHYYSMYEEFLNDNVDIRVGKWRQLMGCDGDIDISEPGIALGLYCKYVESALTRMNLKWTAEMSIRLYCHDQWTRVIWPSRHVFERILECRLMLAQVLEGLILADRLAYLQECGVHHCKVVRLFDPLISARHAVVIATKDRQGIIAPLDGSLGHVLYVLIHSMIWMYRTIDWFMCPASHRLHLCAFIFMIMGCIWVASIPLAAMTSTASIVYDQLIEGAVRLGGRLVTGHNWRISVSVLNKQHGVGEAVQRSYIVKTSRTESHMFCVPVTTPSSDLIEYNVLATDGDMLKNIGVKPPAYVERQQLQTQAPVVYKSNDVLMKIAYGATLSTDVKGCIIEIEFLCSSVAADTRIMASELFTSLLSNVVTSPDSMIVNDIVKSVDNRIEQSLEHIAADYIMMTNSLL